MGQYRRRTTKHSTALCQLTVALALSTALSLALLGLTSSGVTAHSAQQGVPSQEPPPTPMLVYGTVRVSGGNVPVGTPVTAWCAAGQAGQGLARLEDGATWYSIDVRAAGGLLPGCDPEEEIRFRIESLPAPQTTTWGSTPSAVVHLTSTFAVEAGKQISADGVTWHDADTPQEALSLEREAPLTWRIGITNISAITVGLSLTDTFDGTPLTLVEACNPSPPALLMPGGEVGSWFICEIMDTARGGTYGNTVHATISAGSWLTTSVDSAYYTAEQIKVYLPLVLRSHGTQ